MIEQNKLDEAFSDHPPPHTDPHHAVNIPDSTSVDSTSPPIQGYPPNHHEFPNIVLYPSHSYFFLFSFTVYFTKDKYL
jgi:hypothetical protein